MTYQVKITPFAISAAKKFSPEVKKAAKAAMKELAHNPYLGKELQAELSGFWSYKFLRYRIVFKINTTKRVIVIWAIGHRRDIYETLGDHLLSLSSDNEK
jgi:mRNA interferase RelE/StbE